MGGGELGGESRGWRRGERGMIREGADGWLAKKERVVLVQRRETMEWGEVKVGRNVSQADNECDGRDWEGWVRKEDLLLNSEGSEQDENEEGRNRWSLTRGGGGDWGGGGAGLKQALINRPGEAFTEIGLIRLFCCGNT